MMLSTNFSLEDWTDTGSRPHLKAGNVMTPEQIEVAKVFCAEVMQPLRDKHGPIGVNCAFRGLAYNTAVGGAKDSQHMAENDDAAVDCRSATHSVDTLAKWLYDNNMPVDQVILETRKGKLPYTWLHISYRVGGGRRQFLSTLNGKNYKPWKP